MQYRKLGRTGLKVSAFCLGSSTYGSQVSEAEATRIIMEAVAGGVNFFDTGDSYVDGKAEEIIGSALNKERHSVVLATKVGWRVGTGANDAGLSRKHIMKGVEDSLHRLQTDYIDLYYVHLPDYDTPIEETLRALDDLVHQGKVRYIACSNFRAWQLCKALWESDVHNLARFDCIESPYNLLTRDIEYELLPLCASEGIGICVYNPLAAGVLTGKYDPNKPPSQGTRFTLEDLGQIFYDRYWSTSNFEAIARLERIAGENGRSLTQFALAWTLSSDTITSTVCGTTSLKQLKENLGAIEVELTEEELKVCDDVWQQLRPLRFFYGR